jgi:hypothetical protein
LQMLPILASPLLRGHLLELLRRAPLLVSRLAFSFLSDRQQQASQLSPGALNAYCVLAHAPSRRLVRIAGIVATPFFLPRPASS